MGRERLNQKEIDTTGCEVEVRTVECGCRKTSPSVVVLYRGIDRRYWVGVCGRCKKKHYQDD